MGASQSQSPRNSPRSASMRGPYRTLSNEETPRSVISSSRNNHHHGRSHSMRERTDRPIRSRPRVRPREHTRASGVGPSASSSSDSSPDTLPPVGLLERLRRLNLDEDYDFMSFSHGTGTLSVSAPANPLALLRQLAVVRRIKCPLCSDQIPLDELEGHMKMCVQKPRVQYNVDTLQYDGGECSICLEDLKKDESIARLPCLCIYHKGCLEMWFTKSRTCPEHPECVPSDPPPGTTEPKLTTEPAPPTVMISPPSANPPPEPSSTSGRLPATDSPPATNPTPATDRTPSSTPTLTSASKDRLADLSYSPDLPSLDSLLAAN